MDFICGMNYGLDLLACGVPVPEHEGEYRAKMRGVEKASLDEGVHYGNIVTVPAYCVGDIAHHISQSTDHMRKDDVIMAVIGSVTGVMDRTLPAGREK